jgi:hypothetical protein
MDLREIRERVSRRERLLLQAAAVFERICHGGEIAKSIRALRLKPFAAIFISRRGQIRE